MGSSGEIRRRDPIHLTQASLQHCQDQATTCPHVPPTTASRMSLLPLRVTQAGAKPTPESACQRTSQLLSLQPSCGTVGKAVMALTAGSCRAVHSRLGGPPGKAQLVCWVIWPWLPNLSEHQSPLQ